MAKKQVQLHDENNNDIYPVIAPAGEVVNLEGNIYFDNLEQTEQRSIRFGYVDNEGVVHKASLYGGAPDSLTTIGLRDSAYNNGQGRAILLYEDVNNAIRIGNSSNSNIYLRKDVYINNHDSPVGTVVTADSSTATACTEGEWLEALSLNLSAGTWVITASVRFSNLDSASTNNLGICLSNSGNNYNWKAAQRHMIASSTAEVTMEVTRVRQATSSVTEHLNVYSNVARNFTSRHITAVRIA